MSSVRERMNIYSLIQDSINNTARHRRRQNESGLNFLELFSTSLEEEIMGVATQIGVDFDFTFENLYQSPVLSDSPDTSGLSVSDLNASSTIELYCSTKEYKYNETECTICTTRYNEKSILRILECNHVFCVTCIDFWLARNTKCPLCKLNLSKSNDNHPNSHESSYYGLDQNPT
jgi:hypothetical protein